MTAGRKSNYDQDIHPAWAWSLAVCDMTDEEIAGELGICIATLYNWEKAHPEFLEAIKKGKKPTDAKAEQSLFQRVTGYEYKERKLTAIRDENTGKMVPYKVETFEKHMPPDVGAAFIWLKNRRPDRWRDKPETSAAEILERLDAVFDKLDGNI